MKGEHKTGFRTGATPILGSKSINDLPKVADTRSYRYWNRRLKTAIEQVRPGTRKGLKYLEQVTEAKVNEFHQGALGRDSVADSIQDMYDLPGSRHKFLDLKEKLPQLNEDLWAILIAKTEDKSEAADKLKAVREGEGTLGRRKNTQMVQPDRRAGHGEEDRDRLLCR